MRLTRQQCSCKSLIDMRLVSLLDMVLCFLVVLTFLFFMVFHAGKNNSGVVVAAVNNVPDKVSELILEIDAFGRIHSQGAETSIDAIEHLVMREGKACITVQAASDATCAHVLPIIGTLMGCTWATSVTLKTECV